MCIAKTHQIEETLRAAKILSGTKGLKDFMQAQKLASPQEEVWDVFNRATLFLAQSGAKFYGNEQIDGYRNRFLTHVSKFEIILGCPILMNSGRKDREKSISACSIPPICLSKMSLSEVVSVVGDYHTRGMGTGFCLDDTDDPAAMVKHLNGVAVSEVERGLVERPVGNMGVLSIHHPKVVSFIRVKTDNPQIKEWKFNLSINVTQSFIDAWIKDEPFTLWDGQRIDPKILLQEIAENAHQTGDPGVVFMDRINAHNRIPQAGQYKTVVPCGEVSLFEGEVCQFAYLNLPSFLKGDVLDKEALREAVHSAVIMLDNAAEANIDRMPNEQSKKVIASVRRVGIGVCGFAELIQQMGLPYDSQEARIFAMNLMSLINFESKWASCLLAKERGPFPLFEHPKTQKDLFIKPFKKYPTEFVTVEDWERLERLFSAHKIRNLATTILPPTGTSSILGGVTGSIEPQFRLVADASFKKLVEKHSPKYAPALLKMAQESGNIAKSRAPSFVKKLFQTAVEIAPENHVLMTAAFQRQVDEGISKTVNLPHSASVKNVIEVFLLAHELGLKGMTIYRDGCREQQPKEL